MPVQNLNLHCHFKFADGRALSGADGTEATSIIIVRPGQTLIPGPSPAGAAAGGLLRPGPACCLAPESLGLCRRRPPAGPVPAGSQSETWSLEKTYKFNLKATTWAAQAALARTPTRSRLRDAGRVVTVTA